MSRTPLDISHKNYPYPTGLWRVVRGPGPISKTEAHLSNVKCCAESGFEPKINRYLAKLGHASREEKPRKLEVRLEHMRDVYAKKCYAQNMKCEGKLRDCSHLTLRRPYRPIMMRTLVREHGIKHWNREQKNFYDKLTADIWGRKKARRLALRKMKRK